MTTKLTLTIEDGVIKNAKNYAKQKGRSLSGLVENYLKSLTGAAAEKEVLTPRVKRLKGAIKLPENFNYKKELEQELTKKYGK
jgi:Family of unknown function (DUF6364)